MRPPPVRGQLMTIAVLLAVLGSVVLMGDRCAGGISHMFDRLAVVDGVDAGAASSSLRSDGGARVHRLHLTRAVDLAHSQETPIPRTAWSEALAASHDLQELSGVDGAVWTSPTGTRVVFEYAHGQVSVPFVDMGTLTRARLLAAVLGARVVGDAGERF